MHSKIKTKCGRRIKTPKRFMDDVFSPVTAVLTTTDSYTAFNPDELCNNFI